MKLIFNLKTTSFCLLGLLFLASANADESNAKSTKCQDLEAAKLAAQEAQNNGDSESVGYGQLVKDYQDAVAAFENAGCISLSAEAGGQSVVAEKEGSAEQPSGSDLQSVDLKPKKDAEKSADQVEEATDPPAEEETDTEETATEKPAPPKPVVQQQKIEIKQTFANEAWNDDYNDKESDAYQKLEIRLKQQILTALSNKDDFSPKEDSVRIISISEEPAAAAAAAEPNRRRRRAVNDSKVKAEYEVIVEFKSADVKIDALKTAVATSLGVSEDALSFKAVSGAGSLVTSLGLILGALVMIL